MFGLFERKSGERERAGELELLLAACLEDYAERGVAAVEELCERRPEHAERIRARMDSLARVGLLGEERGGEVPARFGPFQILRRLGQGGMGTVYLAFDEVRVRRVALKVAHALAGAGERTRVRFEREIRAVAQLAHPGILPVLDVGESEGRAYFTMELAPGATLAEIVTELRRERAPLDGFSARSIGSIVLRRSGELLDDGAAGAEERAAALAGAAWGQSYVEAVCRVALDVARALEHAHASGIVHRDVKPSNVIVRRDGRAQLLDFGLARVEDQPALTRSGDFAGTPYYVSPEQIAGRASALDGRTDVYSLGVTLYELATLRRPFEGRGSPEILRAIQVEEPALLRKHNPQVPRDLETICLTAMEKNPARRYASAREMAEDLERFLEFRPVRARPIGAVLRGARFVRRNPALASASMLVAFVLAGLPFGLLWANAAIREQRDRAELAAREARAQAALNAQELEFLVELFHLAGPEEPAGEPARELAAEPGSSPARVGARGEPARVGARGEPARVGARGETVTAREILDRGVARIETEFAGEPLVCAALLEATGRVYYNLGLNERALPLLDRSFALFHRELGETHLDVAIVLHELAAVHLELGNVGAALALAQRSLAALESAGHGRHLAAARCHAVLARASEELGQLELAEEHGLAALAILRASGGPGNEAAAEALERLGGLAGDRGEHDLAAERYAAALARRRDSWAPDPLALARTLERLAREHERCGALELAARCTEEALALREGAAREPARAPAVSTGSTGFAGASPAAGEAPFQWRPAWKAEYDRHFQAGITALQSGEYEEARRAFASCLELDPTRPVCAYNLTCAYALAGDVPAALEWFARAEELGFAFAPKRLEVARKDAELDALRADPRFAPVLERMEREAARALSFAAEPAAFVPSGAPPRGGWPLLVVLHAEGSTKDAILAGPWRALALELGLALLAPSGTRPSASKPEAGMAWIDGLEEFLTHPLAFEQPIREDVRLFCERAAIDRERIAIAGEGQGALLAFDLALRAPALFEGVLVRNGPFGAEIGLERTLAAASMGLRVEVVLDAEGPLPLQPPDLGREELARSLEEWLERCGMGEVSRVRLCPAPGGREPGACLRDAVRALLP